MLISCTAPQASLEPVSRESFRAVVREGGDARLGWNEEEAEEEEEEEQEEQEEDEVSTLLGGSESKTESKSNTVPNREDTLTTQSPHYVRRM